MNGDGWTTVNYKGAKSKNIINNANEKFKDDITPKEENKKQLESASKEVSDILKEERKRQSMLKKQKLKEEKKYKREQRLREEQERKRRDTKVKVISQKDLEQSNSSLKNNPKINYQSSQNTYLTNLNEYPTLGVKTQKQNSSMNTTEKLSSPTLNNWVNNNNNNNNNNNSSSSSHREHVKNQQSAFKPQTSVMSHDTSLITTQTDKVQSSIPFSSSTITAPNQRRKVKTKDLINLDIMDLIELKKKNEASKTKVPIRPPQNIPEKVERKGKVSLAKKKLTTLRKNQIRQKQAREESEKEASENSERIIKLSTVQDKVSELKSSSALLNDFKENDYDCEENDCLSIKAENIERTTESKNSENNVTDELINDLKYLIFHSKKFREYCNHVRSPEIDKNLKELIEMVVYFQQRLYSQDPVKAKMRRRYYCGFREALKHMNSLKCLVIAPNLRPSPGKGCLDELINKVVSTASERGVMTIFGLSDRILGRLCHRKARVGCISLINVQGAQEKFERLQELLPQAKEQYENLLKSNQHKSL